MISFKRFGAVLLTAVMAISGLVFMPHAEANYPEKPIRVILGMPASSTFPIIANAITDNVQDRRMNFYNDHKVGLGNMIAYQAAAASKPDGYTIFFASTSIVINPFLYKSAGYNPLTDFDLLVVIGKVDNALLVHPSVPFRNVPEMIKFARANPERITYGHNGHATQSYLGVELLASMTKTRFMSIPYSTRGTDQAILDLFSGSIDLHVPVIGRAGGYVASKKAKILATTGATRSALFPDVPTVGESVPGFESSIWYALMAPKGISDSVKQHLIRELTKGLAHPTTQKILTNTGVDKYSPKPDFMATEQQKWGKLVAEKQIKPE